MAEKKVAGTLIVDRLLRLYLGFRVANDVRSQRQSPIQMNVLPKIGATLTRQSTIELKMLLTIQRIIIKLTRYLASSSSRLSIGILLTNWPRAATWKPIKCNCPTIVSHPHNPSLF